MSMMPKYGSYLPGAKMPDTWWSKTVKRLTTKANYIRHSNKCPDVLYVTDRELDAIWEYFEWFFSLTVEGPPTPVGPDNSLYWAGVRVENLLD